MQYGQDWFPNICSMDKMSEAGNLVVKKGTRYKIHKSWKNKNNAAVGMKLEI